MINFTEALELRISELQEVMTRIKEQI